jgi:hypothetical protein
LLALQAFRRPRTLLGALPVTVLLLALGTAAAGRGWVFPWVHSLPAFAEASGAADGANEIGLAGVARATVGAPAVGLVAALLVAVALVVVWRSHLVAPPARWALTAMALPWMPPHSLFYDAGSPGWRCWCSPRPEPCGRPSSGGGGAHRHPRTDPRRAAARALPALLGGWLLRRR